MRLDKVKPSPQGPPAKSTFRQVLVRIAPKRIAGPPARASPHPGLPPTPKAQTLLQARRVMDQEAARLTQVRAEHHASSEERIDGRVIDLVCRELLSDCPERRARAGEAALTPALPLGTGPGPPSAPAMQEGIAATRSAVLELIERIEVFVRSRRPVLALTVGGALQANVEVERTAPGEVALKLACAKRRPPPELLSRLRDELRARGLKVSALSID